MTDYQGDVKGASTPMELYEKLGEQGEKVRSLKSAEADKVRHISNKKKRIKLIMFLLRKVNQKP